MKPTASSDFSDYVEVGEALRDFNERTARAVDRLLSVEGISLSRLRYLTFIAGKGSARSIDLLQHFGFAPRTITEAIDGLERDGLVERVSDLVDRRAKNISLTKEGKVILRKVDPLLRRYGKQLFAVLELNERKQLASLLQRLNDRVAAMDQSEFATV